MDLNISGIYQIRNKYLTGKYFYKELAKEYGVKLTTIQSIIQNKNWYDKNYNPPRGRKNPLTKEQENEIYQKYIPGKRGYISLGKEYGVSASYIRTIVERKNKCH